MARLHYVRVRYDTFETIVPFFGVAEWICRGLMPLH